MEEKALVIFHASCMDGFVSAWVMRKWLRETQSHIHHREYHAAQYNDKALPDVTGKHVWIVDFSYPAATLQKMRTEAASLAVIDHHKSAEEAVRSVAHVFDLDRSGAGLCWDTFFPDQPRPWIVNYVEDRDLWLHKLPDTQAINALLSSWPKDFRYWDLHYRSGHDGFEVYKQAGHAILQYIDRCVEDMVPNACKVWFEGCQINFINMTGKLISEVGHALAQQGEVAYSMSYFRRADGAHVYSLRSIGEFDVSEVAQRHGGGGHRNASGFVGLPPVVLAPDSDAPTLVFLEMGRATLPVELP